MALALGLRQGEALGLRWQDVDLDRRRLQISQALQRVDGTLQLVETKTARSRRTIVVPGAVAEALQRHRARQLEDRLLAGPHWTDSGFVFTTRRGTPIDGAAVRRSFPRLLVAAGLPRMRFHDLRHSCASLLLAQGVVDGDGGPRPFADRPDSRHLLACYAAARRAGSRRDGARPPRRGRRRVGRIQLTVIGVSPSMSGRGQFSRSRGGAIAFACSALVAASCGSTPARSVPPSPSPLITSLVVIHSDVAEGLLWTGTPSGQLGIANTHCDLSNSPGFTLNSLDRSVSITFSLTGSPIPGDYPVPDAFVTLYDSQKTGPGIDTLFLVSSGNLRIAQGATAGHVDVWLAPQASGDFPHTPGPPTTHLVGDWSC